MVPGPAGPPPAELAALVRPWLRTAPLTPVAHLRTVRRSSALRFDDRGVVGSVDDDEVSVLQAGRVAARFREVEVEVAGAAPEGVLDAVVGRLRAAGAGAPDPTPKLVRALGPRALQPPDLVVADVGRDASAAEVLRAGIAVAVLRIVEHDRTIRDDAEPEGIHQARVGTRRLRSDLRTFASLLDTAWSEPLRDELRWLAGELGEVRDRDVLAGRLRAQIAELDEDDRVAAGGVLVKLDRERTRAVARAVGALDSRRYLALLDRLVEAANDPRTLAEAEMRAREVLPGLAGATFHSLRKGVKQLGKHPKDEALHRLRIKAKRARYAADVAVPVVGEPAKTYTKAMGALQDVLGDHHDCSVAAEWLRGALPGATKAEAFALGLLVARQHHGPTSSDRSGGRRGTPSIARSSWRGSMADAKKADEVPAGTVRAAGGIVWRLVEPANEVEVLVIHRPHYDDWSFPKGKCDADEGDEACAVREVEEETGLRCTVGHELPSVSYVDGRGRPKVVRYWEMAIAEDLGFEPGRRGRRGGVAARRRGRTPPLLRPRRRPPRRLRPLRGRPLAPVPDAPKANAR